MELLEGEDSRAGSNAAAGSRSSRQRDPRPGSKALRLAADAASSIETSSPATSSGADRRRRGGEESSTSAWPGRASHHRSQHLERHALWLAPLMSHEQARAEARSTIAATVVDGDHPVPDDHPERKPFRGEELGDVIGKICTDPRRASRSRPDLPRPWITFSIARSPRIRNARFSRRARSRAESPHIARQHGGSPRRPRRLPASTPDVLRIVQRRLDA